VIVVAGGGGFCAHITDGNKLVYIEIL
jgi:hypothetical protein